MSTRVDDVAETIPSLFIRQASRLGSQTLFLVKREGVYRPISWRDVAEDVLAFSTFLLSEQVNPGDRIVLFSENRPEWSIADLGIQSVGAWTVPLYPSLTAQDLRIICNDCEPAVCVVSRSEQAEALLCISGEIRSIRLVVVMEATSRQVPHPPMVRWIDALGRGRGLRAQLDASLERRRQQVQPNDTATIIYTSGTTGEPKGVMLSHRNFLSNAAACSDVMPITHRDLHLSFLPLSHVFERMAGWYLMLAVGSRIAYAESMETIPQNMLEVRPTVMLGVPRFFEKLYARIQDNLRQVPPQTRRLVEWALRIGRLARLQREAGRALSIGLRMKLRLADLFVFRKLHVRLGGRLRFLISGGAPLSKEIAEFFYSVGVVILEGYGLTETSPVITVNRLPIPRFGSVGKTVPGVEIHLAEDGEILTRGPHVMQGYYRKPEATAAVLIDGWFRTGDIGYVDRDDYLFITDRKKDLIKTAGGKFVAPQKLETLFGADPYISQAFVYGDKQPYCVALIVPHIDQLRRYAQEQEIPARAIQELVRDPRILEWYWHRVQAKQQGLPSFEQVKKIALLDQEFSQAAGELTPTLKAKRAAIAQRYQQLLLALYQTPSS